MGIEVIEEYWPLVIEIYRGKASSEQLEFHRNQMRGIVARGDRYGMIYDLRDAEPESLEERKKDAKLIKELEDQIESLSVGVAFVVSSTMIRITMNFIFFVAPPPMPYKVVETIKEGTCWLKGEFAKAGLEFSAEGEVFLQALESRDAA